MPYITSMLTVMNTQTALATIKTNWNNKEERVDAEKLIKNFFPNTNIPMYDAYFLFPKHSHVCIGCSTNTELSIDCYSGNTKECSTDFAHVLRRLQTLLPLQIAYFEVVFEKLGFLDYLYDALIPGGAVLFIAPPITETFAPDNYKIGLYVVIAISFTSYATIYSWWKRA